jgi:hypothetical protein
VRNPISAIPPDGFQKYPLNPSGTQADRREARGTKRCCVRSRQRGCLGPFSAQRVRDLLRLPGIPVGRFCRSLGPLQAGPVCPLHAAGSFPGAVRPSSLAAELDLKPTKGDRKRRHHGLSSLMVVSRVVASKPPHVRSKGRVAPPSRIPRQFASAVIRGRAVRLVPGRETAPYCAAFLRDFEGAAATLAAEFT